jgi:hypothetical protein
MHEKDFPRTAQLLKKEEASADRFSELLKGKGICSATEDVLRERGIISANTYARTRYVEIISILRLCPKTGPKALSDKEQEALLALWKRCRSEAGLPTEENCGTQEFIQKWSSTMTRAADRAQGDSPIPSLREVAKACQVNERLVSFLEGISIKDVASLARTRRGKELEVFVLEVGCSLEGETKYLDDGEKEQMTTLYEACREVMGLPTASGQGSVADKVRVKNVDDILSVGCIRCAG